MAEFCGILPVSPQIRAEAGAASPTPTRGVWDRLAAQQLPSLGVFLLEPALPAADVWQGLGIDGQQCFQSHPCYHHLRCCSGTAASCPVWLWVSTRGSTPIASIPFSSSTAHPFCTSEAVEATARDREPVHLCYIPGASTRPWKNINPSTTSELLLQVCNPPLSCSGSAPAPPRSPFCCHVASRGSGLCSQSLLCNAPQCLSWKCLQ